MYKFFLKKLLFLLDPESAHHLTFKLMSIPLLTKFLGWFYHIENPALHRNLFGLTFKNPVGLAAGFDKNALLYSQLGDLGFGFIEIGTVTPKAQAGNPLPRLFRLPKDEALINRMGFNNDGVKAVCQRLKNRQSNLLIGGNIGKNKTTPNECAIEDYQTAFNALYDYVDYFVLNVSSPNTPNLRELQDKEPLTRLLQHIKKLNRQKPREKPVLLKIAPDLNHSQLDDIIAIVEKTGIDGLIAVNTTISRKNLKTEAEILESIGSGGLSGKPLALPSTEVIRYIHQKSGGAIPIIGVGGIHSPEDAIAKFEAGASLVQIYTGFIYEGPGLIKRINKALLKQGYV